MKVQTVELKDLEFVTVNGEYQQRFINEKTYPAFLTNAAMKRGFDTGLIESSLWEDLIKIKGLESVVKSSDEKSALQAMNALDEQKMIAIVYLAVIGANKKLTISYDEFLERYHYSFDKTLQLYANLLTNMMSSNPNEFSGKLKNATKKNKKKHQ